MTSHARGKRRYRKTQGRRVWVFSDLNHDLQPEHLANIITAAGLERAQLEAEAQADATSRRSRSAPSTEKEPGHA